VNTRVVYTAARSYSSVAVPVIAIFTKMDALDKKVFSEQLNKGIPIQEAKKGVPSLAKAKFEQDYLGPLTKISYPPQRTVQLRSRFSFIKLLRQWKFIQPFAIQT
jgi:hypothetical protein